ncbi:hypothetical protein C5167_032640 [Papaver somniferum]|uniref:DNA topoisomerase (ATP-hydrolyzing) n=1 Tax=Papaver somniferum TaxID=3469 RepID=A0A4Y7KAT7_PAPSO|nr:hypothetical protein C5167_032640 [Papaver somniferum]
MVYRPVSYVPGLYKIFDEILVNAADNKQRDPKIGEVKVDFGVEGNTKVNKHRKRVRQPTTTDDTTSDIECGSANIETKRKQVERRERSTMERTTRWAMMVLFDEYL